MFAIFTPLLHCKRLYCVLGGFKDTRETCLYGQIIQNGWIMSQGRVDVENFLFGKEALVSQKGKSSAKPLIPTQTVELIKGYRSHLQLMALFALQNAKYFPKDTFCPFLWVSPYYCTVIGSTVSQVASKKLEKYAYIVRPSKMVEFWAWEGLMLKISFLGRKC